MKTATCAFMMTLLLTYAGGVCNASETRTSPEGSSNAVQETKHQQVHVGNNSSFKSVRQSRPGRAQSSVGIPTAKIKNDKSAAPQANVTQGGDNRLVDEFGSVKNGHTVSHPNAGNGLKLNSEYEQGVRKRAQEMSGN